MFRLLKRIFGLAPAEHAASRANLRSESIETLEPMVLLSGSPFGDGEQLEDPEQLGDEVPDEQIDSDNAQPQEDVLAGLGNTPEAENGQFSQDADQTASRSVQPTSNAPDIQDDARVAIETSDSSRTVSNSSRDLTVDGGTDEPGSPRENPRVPQTPTPDASSTGTSSSLPGNSGNTPADQEFDDPEEVDPEEFEEPASAAKSSSAEREESNESDGEKDKKKKSDGGKDKDKKSDGDKDKKSDGDKDKKSDGDKDKKSDGDKDKKSDGDKDKKSDGGKDKKSDGDKDKKKSDGGKDKKSDGGKDKKSDGGKDKKKSDGGKDKKKSDGGKDKKKSDGGKDKKKSDGGKDKKKSDGGKDKKKK